jgi:hypothetical protein
MGFFFFPPLQVPPTAKAAIAEAVDRLAKPKNVGSTATKRPPPSSHLPEQTPSKLRKTQAKM